MRSSCLASFLACLVTISTPAVAQRFGGTVTIDEPQLSDQYVAGRIVRVNAPVQGDLVVAGQRLIIGARIAGDLNAAGETVDLRNAVADDVRAAGRTVDVGGPVSGHIVAAGADVTLALGSSIAEWAWLAGRTIRVDGMVGQELRAAGESVTLNGRVDGDASLMGQTIRLGPDAVVGGDLIVQSQTEPDIADGATIMGEIIREDLPEDVGGGGPFGLMGGLAGFAYLAAALLTAVLTVAFVFPRFSQATSDRLTARPLPAVGTGLLAAIGMPVLIVLVCMTGIGLIVGFGLMAAYALMLLLGGLLGLVAAGRLGLRLARKDAAPRTLTHALALVVATLAVLLIVQIPVLGGLVALVLIVSGLGAVTGELWGRYRQTA